MLVGSCLALRACLLVPARPPPRMQIFPADDMGSASLPRVSAQPSRGERMAALLGTLVDRPEDGDGALRDATPMLLEPFRPGALPEEGSIFTAAMPLDEKVALYAETLERRIGAARQLKTKEALRRLKNHVLSSISEELGGSVQLGDGGSEEG